VTSARRPGYKDRLEAKRWCWCGCAFRVAVNDLMRGSATAAPWVSNARWFWKPWDFLTVGGRRHVLELLLRNCAGFLNAWR
jgi:hypothetical protein